jgi:hypothetical protein
MPISKRLFLAGAAATSLGFALTAWAQSGPGKLPALLKCPAQAVTIGVKNPAVFPKPWWDSPYVMQLDSLSTSIPVGGQPGLTCIYKGSGRQWEVSRPMAPQYKSCSVNGKVFHCTPV